MPANARLTLPCIRLALSIAFVATLAGCAAPAPPPAPLTVPAQWQAPLPHAGQRVALDQWWQQFDDTVLLRLLASAQDVSPTVASARSRIEQARAARVGAGATLVPTLDGNLGATRGRLDNVTPVVNTASASLQLAWEIDVFGGQRAARDAAQARFEGAEAGWHDARVAVAAEVATSYTALRACEAALEQQRSDAASRAQTARLVELRAKAGFDAPADAALSRASAAQANSLLTQRRAQCDSLVKGLVALTDIAEPDLRKLLSGTTARVPSPPEIEVRSVPAQVLAQRPDVLRAEREMLAARADVWQAQAKRYPSVRLNGNIGALHVETPAGNSDGTLWAIGPISVVLPIFDGGVRRANVDAAQARTVESDALYRSKLRTAIREVEDALIALQSTADRTDDSSVATEGFAASLRATEIRYRGGLASLFELEDARRSAVLAQIALIDLQRERSTAWIDLYRALGGGWTTADTGPLATAP